MIVEGLREVEEAFSDLGAVVARRLGRRALREGGEITARRARQLAPRDSGELIESIDVATRLTRRQRSQHRKQDPIEMFVGANNPSAIPQEFGTFKDPAQPFMRPAWDATQREVLDRIGKELFVGIEREAQRQARRTARLARNR